MLLLFVVGKDAGRQPILAVVGQLDRLVERFDFGHGQHGREKFVLEQTRVFGRAVHEPPDAVVRKLDVGNHSEHVLFIFDEVAPCILERAAQQNLRPRLQAHHLVRQVYPFRHQTQSVVHQLGVDHRQKRRIEPDVVLDDDDDLNAELADVVRHIHAIFDQVHHRRQNADVALPEKDPGQIAGVVRRHEIRGERKVRVCRKCGTTLDK